MCLSMMKVKSDDDTGKKIFVKHFMNELVRISSDRVVNVRMSLSEVLSVHHAQNPQNSLIRELKPLNDIYQLLKKDKSADVREPLLSITGVDRLCGKYFGKLFDLLCLLNSFAPILRIQRIILR